jgi:hypothetical protein
LKDIVRTSHARLIRASRSLAGLVAALLLVCACQGQTLIDGYPVRERMCEDPEQLHPDGDGWFCGPMAAFAEARLDEIAPGHVEVVSVEHYQHDYRMANGDRPFLYRSGGSPEIVVVLRLADGTVRAVFVTCGGGPSREPCIEVPPDYWPEEVVPDRTLD